MFGWEGFQFPDVFFFQAIYCHPTLRQASAGKVETKSVELVDETGGILVKVQSGQ